MYGTIYRLQPKPGKLEQALEHLRSWEKTQLPRTSGFVAAYILQSDSRPGELINVAIFDSEESYRKNGAVPGQDLWYRQLHELLEADPEWNDGRYVLNMQGSGSGL